MLGKLHMGRWNCGERERPKMKKKREGRRKQEREEGERETVTSLCISHSIENTPKLFKMLSFCRNPGDRGLKIE